MPGAGIGGLFYLAAALIAPAWHGLRALRRRTGRVHGWRFVGRLALYAGLMVGGISLMGWALGYGLTSPAVMVRMPGAPLAPGDAPQFIARAALVLTFATLVAVLVAVEMLRVLMRWRSPARQVRAAEDVAHEGSGV
jgi:hypothetical protein